MRKQFIMLSFLGVFSVGYMAVPAFADDVYVDLSVLRELGSDNPVADTPAPLFPEVKSSRARVVETSFPTVSSQSTTHKSIARKKTIKPQKAKPRKPVVKADKTDKIVIPEKAVPVSGLKVSVPTVELKPVSENMEQNAAAPVVKIKKEPLPELEVEPSPTPTPDLSSEAAQITAQPVVSQAFETAKEKAETQAPLATDNSTAPNIEQPAAVPSNTETQPETTKAVADSVAVQNQTEPKPAGNEMVFIPQTGSPASQIAQPTAVSEPEPAVENNVPNNPQPQLLVPAPSSGAAVGANEIEFAPGSEDLTPANLQKIDTIVTSFDDPKNNMIAINAYNYDDGNDVFGKKRLSLRRIVAIRSYLLNKGYKNFMPKVINITDDNGKSDLVELEEVK